MFKILVKTESFLEEFCEREIKKFYKKDFNKKNYEFELEFKDQKSLCLFLENILYFSRTIKSIYLNGEDLFGFDLSNREYRINKDKNSLNSLISSFLFYKLGIDKKKEFSVIDPKTGLGDMIIECSLFRETLNVKKRNEVNFAQKFDYSLKIPIQVKSKSKFIAVVQENSHFKKLKENISYANSKIKVSQFDFDMLDVKFKDKQFDFVISNVSSLDEEDLKDFFYMSEFISKKIGVICESKINKKLYEEYDLEIVSFDKISFNEKGYYVYVLK